MSELKIEYIGGYRQTSKHLTRKHSANFSVIVDALVYIYNENLDKLIEVKGDSAVKISNGYLSRATGLSMDVVKSNVKKIEELGLVAVVKKGQGNTRHYVIHIDHIDKYIKVLEGEFEEWFGKSLKASKKDKSRSDKADEIKLEKSIEAFEETLAGIKSKSVKPIKRLVDIPPTQQSKTHQPKRVKPTVAERTEGNKVKETTTRTNNVNKDVVVPNFQTLSENQVFNKNDEKGSYIIINDENVDEKVYKKDYEDYMMKNKEVVIDYIHIIVEDDDEVKNPILYAYNKIYNAIRIGKRTREKKAKKEYETTNKAADKDVSKKNWNKLRDAYDDLPQYKNQGKFFISKNDENNFYALSEYRQENVISCITANKKSGTTTSRPAFYINEAMEGKIKKIDKPKEYFYVAL